LLDQDSVEQREIAEEPLPLKHEQRNNRRKDCVELKENKVKRINDERKKTNRLNDGWLFGGGEVDDGWRIRTQSYFLPSVAISRLDTTRAYITKRGTIGG
jgi:hypothetical protein